MKVIVTGGSGRIGQYVTTELIAHGHTVTVFDRTQPSTIEGVRWLRGDIQNLGDVISAFQGNDAVVHLAAYPNPTQEVLRHVLFRNNVMGTFNVHEAAFCVNIRRVVMMSSAAVLGWPYYDVAFAPKYLPIDEQHPTLPQDPYGLGKLCEEQIARAYALKSGMLTIALRPERVLLPDVSEKIRRENGIRFTRYHLFGYVDVRDLATACRRAVENSTLQHEIMFVGADDSLSSEPLCDLIPRLMPEVGEIARSLTGIEDTYRANEPNSYCSGGLASHGECPAKREAVEEQHIQKRLRHRVDTNDHDGLIRLMITEPHMRSEGSE